MNEIACHAGRFCSWIHNGEMVLGARVWLITGFALGVFALLAVTAFGFYALGFHDGRRHRGKVYVP